MMFLGIRPGPWVISLVVLVTCMVIFASIFVPAIRKAHEAAQRTQSMNNLKQIALAFHNYHDSLKRFPPGGISGKNDQVLYGWQTPVIPFMEATALHSMIDLRRPWNDPLNAHVYRRRFDPYSSPRIMFVQSETGHYLSHYSANQRLFYLDSRCQFSDLSAGDSNVWLCSEIFDDFRPWGAPYNWHDFEFPLRHHAKVHGWSHGGTGLALADGAVDYFDNDTDLEFVDSLRNNLPRPTSSLTNRPKDNSVLLTKQKGWHTNRLIMHQADGLTVDAIVWSNPTGQAIHAYASSRSGKAYGEVSHEYLQQVLQEYPGLETLVSNTLVDLKSIETLSQGKSLLHLKLGRTELTPAELPQLGRLDSLQILSVAGDETIRDPFRKTLPACEIRFRTIDEFGFDKLP